MPQQASDPLDEMLKDISDPEERARAKEEYLRQLTAEEREKFKASVPQTQIAPGPGGPLKKTLDVAVGEPTWENLARYGSAAGAGAAGGGGLLGAAIGAGSQLGMDYLTGHGVAGEEPQRYVDPVNVANWSAALTNILTGKLIPAPARFAGRLGKELIEQYVPFMAYQAEREREGRKLLPEELSGEGEIRDKPSWGEMAFPGGMALSSTAIRDLLMRNAAKSPAWVSKMFKEELPKATGEVPTQEQAWQQMGQLGERSAAAADLMPQITATQQELAAMPKAAAQKRLEEAGKAAGMSKEEIEALQAARVQTETQRSAQINTRQASLMKTTRDLRLMKVERRQLKEELSKISQPSGEEDLAENAQRTARIATINSRLAQLDEYEPELIKAEAQLRYSLGVKKANTAEVQKNLTAVEKAATATGKMDQAELNAALRDWQQIGTNEQKLRDLTAQLHEKTGWKPENLGPAEMQYIQRMAKDHPTQLIDEVVGRTLKGEVDYTENTFRNFGETMNRILNPQDRAAFRAQVAQRIIGDYWDPVQASLHPMETKLGKNFEPGGLSRLGKAGVNEVFQSPNAWDNLNKLAKQVTAASPGPNNLYLIRSGVIGTVGLFILGYRFTEAHPTAGTAAIAGVGTVIGAIALNRFVDKVIREASRNPEKKIFQLMQNRMFMPAKGTAGTSFTRALTSGTLGPPADMTDAERQQYLDAGSQRYSDQLEPQQ